MSYIGIDPSDTLPSSSFDLRGRNLIINGNFDIWQRGTSFTANNYAADRWYNAIGGSANTMSRQSFTIGQTTVPNNPTYYCRNVVTSSAGAGNFVVLLQKLEDVTKTSGKTITLSFWAKADASKNIAIEYIQNFGTGGSPSGGVEGIGVTTCALTTSWQKFTITTTMPSISGKTLGTDNNHCVQLDFWFDAGSNHNARSNSLGQQSGTFEIAQVQLEINSTATTFENRTLGEELILCQRYYEKSYNIDVTPGTVTSKGTALAITSAAGATWFSVGFNTTKRGSPACTAYSPATGNSGYFRNTSAGSDITATFDANYIGTSRFFVYGSTTANHGCAVQWTADAEL